MSFRTDVFVERHFVWIGVSRSINRLTHNTELKSLRADLIDPIIDQSYQSQLLLFE